MFCQALLDAQHAVPGVSEYEDLSVAEEAREVNAFIPSVSNYTNPSIALTGIGNAR
jgi:hypothetical protein